MSSARERLERYPSLGSLGEFRKQAESIGDVVKRAATLARLEALDAFAAGDSSRSVEDRTSIKRQKVHDFAKRLELYGLDGIIKGKHVAPRKADSTLLAFTEAKPNQLTALFQKYRAEIEQPWIAGVVHGKLKGKNAGPPLTNAEARALLKELAAEAGIADGQFPRTNDNRLLRTLPRRIAKLREQEAQRQAAAAAAVREALDDAYGPRTEVAPYVFVQMDAHKIHITITITAPSLKGRGTVTHTVHDVLVIVVWEAYSGAVMGYSVGFGTNYKGADVCQAIQRALVPWKPRDLGDSKLKYKKGDCLPNAAHPDLSNICFDNMLVDRALANMKADARAFCDATVKCSILAGPVGHPNVRANIENLFAQLEKAIFENLPVSTGSGPNDERADQGGRKTLRTATLKFILDLIDVVICRWNNSKAVGCDQTHNQLLILEAERKQYLFRRIPLDMRSDLETYNMIVNEKFNKHGELYWYGANYELPSELLKKYSKEQLRLQEILIRAHSADLRDIEIILRTTGERFGPLKIEDRFYGTPQPLQVRIMTIANSRGRGFGESVADLSLAARVQLIEKVEKGDVSAAHLARMIHDAERAEQLEGLPPRGAPAPAGDAAAAGLDVDSGVYDDTLEVDGLDSDAAETSSDIPESVRRRLDRLGTST